MDLALSRRGDYVLRAALDLARAWEHGGYRKIREVAEEMDLPRSYTPRILALLAQAGLATARAGRDGGYRLVRSPDEISLLDVVEAGHGNLAPAHCTLRGGPCRWNDVCALHPAWRKGTEALESALRETSLASVALANQALAKGQIPIPEGTRPIKTRRLQPAPTAELVGG